jgi:hypothetical protein
MPRNARSDGPVLALHSARAMRIHASLLLALFATAGCGTSPAGEPLISGAVNGTYETSTFDVKYGVAAAYGSGFVILLSSDAINCDSVTANEPPAGQGAVVSLPALDVGQYGNVEVEVIQNLGSFMGTGSNSGSVQITASSTASIAGTVAYSATIDGKSYAVNGTFEVTRCAD